MDEETQAIARLRRGDPQGLEFLAQRYYQQAARSAFLILHDPTQAEDVAQQAFLRLLDTIGQFDPSRPFAPWFLRSVINAAINQARQGSRSIPLEAEPSPNIAIDLERLIDPRPGPEECLEASEFRRQVWGALQSLAPEQRAVIVMRYYLEMSEGEMSAEMDSPPSSIKWWLRSSRLRLRSLLEIFHPPGDPPSTNPHRVSSQDRS